MLTVERFMNSDWKFNVSLDGTLLSHIHNESEFFLLPSTVRICRVRAPKDRKHPLPVSIFNVLDVNILVAY